MLLKDPDSGSCVALSGCFLTAAQRGWKSCPSADPCAALNEDSCLADARCQPAYALDAEALAATIAADLAAGRRPCAIVATTGTTATTAMDPLDRCAQVAQAHGVRPGVHGTIVGGRRRSGHRHIVTRIIRSSPNCRGTPGGLRQGLGHGSERQEERCDNI